MVSKRIWPLGALLIFIWNSKSITVILTTNLWPMLVISKNVSTQKIRSERMKPLHYSIPLPNGLIKFPGNIQVLPRKFTSDPLDFWNVVSTWISMNNDSGYIKYGRWICQTSSWFNTSIKECPVRNWFITGPDLNWFKLVLSMLKGYFMVQVWIPWVCVIPYVSYGMTHTVCRDVGCPDSEALDESLNSNWSTHNLFYFYSLWKPLRRSGKYAVYCTIQVNCYSRVIIIGHETIGT